MSPGERMRARLVAGILRDGHRRAMTACDCVQATEAGADAGRFRVDVLMPERLDALDTGKVPFLAVFAGDRPVTVLMAEWSLSSMIDEIRGGIDARAGAEDPAGPFDFRSRLN